MYLHPLQKGNIVCCFHISSGRSNTQILVLQGTNMHDSQSRRKDAQSSKDAQSFEEHSAARSDLLTGSTWRGEEMAKYVQPYGDGGNDFQNQLIMLDWATLDTTRGFRTESWNSRTALTEPLRPGKHEIQEASHYKELHAPVFAPWVSQLPLERSDPKRTAIWSEINSIFIAARGSLFLFWGN